MEIVHKFRNMHLEKGWVFISCRLIFNTKYSVFSQTESLKPALFSISKFANNSKLYLCKPKMCMDTDKQFQNTVCDKHKTCLVMDMSLIEDIACQTHSKYSLIRKCVCTIKFST